MPDQPPFSPDEDRLFDELATGAESFSAASERPASARLKSRIYSSLVQAQGSEEGLMSLSECKRSGGRLCIFEELVQIAPVGERVKSLNYCRVCHARVLAEILEQAPIYWPGCPYVRFQNR